MLYIERAVSIHVACTVLYRTKWSSLYAALD